jgi:GNAT superfamily N-acetyltransferase
MLGGVPRTLIEFHSLLVATDVDVLSQEAQVEDRGDYVVVRTPAVPDHYWGNFLVWREPPGERAREAWEGAFEREFPDDAIRHRAFAWEGPASRELVEREFADAGYDIEDTVALVAEPQDLVPHSRANADVYIRMLDPASGADDGDWQAVEELQVRSRGEGHTESDYRTFVRTRMLGLRERFREGDGGWFVAVSPEGELVASCGIVVTEGRARFQAVDTALEHRRQGIASRLVHDAGRCAIDRFGARQLVIAADAGYHALDLYRSLGFVERERGLSVTWWPTAPHAALHPTLGGSSSE